MSISSFRCIPHTVPLRHIAIHEAAHALVALALGVPFDSVELLPSDDPEIYGLLRLTPGPIHPLPLLHVYLAGPTAEAIYLGHGPDWHDDELHESDLELADWAAREHYGRRAHHAVLQADLRVRRWLTRHWQAVEAIAQALLQSRLLPAQDVQQLARAHGIRPSPRMAASLLPRARAA